MCARGAKICLECKEWSEYRLVIPKKVQYFIESNWNCKLQFRDALGACLCVCVCVCYNKQLTIPLYLKYLKGKSQTFK